MTNLELQKAANEVRKGIITGVHAAKAGIRAVRCRRQMSLHTFISRR